MQLSQLGSGIRAFRKNDEARLAVSQETTLDWSSERICKRIVAPCGIGVGSSKEEGISAWIRPESFSPGCGGKASLEM